MSGSSEGGRLSKADRERIETEIRNLLAAESSAVVLANKLFSPQGLFNQLGGTVEDRERAAQSPLFKEALRRLAELRKAEAAEFASAVARARAELPTGEYLLKLEPVP
jgi:hypothetical protein